MSSVPDKAKVNVKPSLKLCYSNLLKNASLFCRHVSFFIRTVRLLIKIKFAQDWIAINCSEFTGKDEWPPNSPDVDPFDYHVCGVYVFEHYKIFHPKPKNINELKKVLQLIWDQLLQDSINKAILSFIKRLRAFVKPGLYILNVL